MGEKLNEATTGGPQVAQAGGGSGTAVAPTPPPGDGTPPTNDPGATAQQGGGGSQADQEKDETRERPRPSGEITFPDGSRTRFGEDGTIEHTDASGRTGRWSGRDQAYWDPQTNEWMPEGWGDPGFENRETATAGDLEGYAGKMNDARRRAQQAGETELAESYQQEYDRAVQEARKLRGSEPRR